MFEAMIASFNRWNALKNERQKLQHCYLALSIVIVLLAGVISLINADSGRTVVKLALVAISAFLVNAFVWNLLQSSVLTKISSKPKRR